VEPTADPHAGHEPPALDERAAERCCLACRKPGDRDEICNEYLAESWDPSNAGFVKRALWFVVQVQRVEQLRFN